MTPAENHPRRWFILAIMCLALVVTALDTLIITMAVPSIRVELGASTGQLQWIADAYSLAFAAPILFAGALADRYGRRLAFLGGMVLFLGASLLAVTAGDATTLVAARAGMGLGAAFIMPSTLSLLQTVFAPDERAKAVGIWVGVASLGIPLGPLVGGGLLEHFWWGSVFLINVPVILIAIVGCVLLIPESRHQEHTGLDGPGLVLSVLGSLALFDGVIEGPTRGWGSLTTLSLVFTGVVALLAFIGWERRTATPMLSNAVFTDRRFGGPLVTIAGVFFSVFGGLFLVTQHLQNTLGRSPLEAGLHLLAMCTAVLVAPNAPKLVQRLGLGPVSALGPLLVGAGALSLTLGESPSGWRVIAALGLMGAGIGFGAPTSVDSVLASTPPQQAGAGSAVADVAAQFGGGLGIAMMGSAAATGTAGLQAGMTVGAAVSVAAAVVVAAVLPGKVAVAEQQTPARG